MGFGREIGLEIKRFQPTIYRQFQESPEHSARRAEGVEPS